MDESALVKRTGTVDTDVEHTTWVEYRLAIDPDADRAVHRSVHVTLKKPGVLSEGKIGKFL
jgi:hypothetical protein